MALDQALHHVGLARRPERRAGLGGLFRRDQRVDDVAALHQQAMHRLVDAVDLAAQVGKGGRSLCHNLAVLGSGAFESKENVDSEPQGPM